MKPRVTPGWACVAAAALTCAARGGDATTSVRFGGFGGVPPDGSPVGVSDTQTVASDVEDIRHVSVEFELEGGGPGTVFNGDYYVSLYHDGALSVLLDRVGRTGNEGPASLGYADNGFKVVFDDLAANGDIHVYRSVVPGIPGVPVDIGYTLPIEGTWAPDGRTDPPGLVDSNSSRGALLNVFDSRIAAGEWTLFVADLNKGGQATVVKWGLTISGATTPRSVPEPGVVCLMVIGALALRCSSRAWSRR